MISSQKIKQTIGIQVNFILEIKMDAQVSEETVILY